MNKLILLLLVLLCTISSVSADLIEYGGWISNESVVSGLPDIGSYSTPTIFNDSGMLKLISGEVGGDFYGYYWNGIVWTEDTDIVNGLPDIGTTSAPTVFNDSGTLKLIAGNDSGFGNGFFTGFEWNGTGWENNATIVDGLGNTGSHSKATVFNDSGVWRLISGNADGDFNGFHWTGSTWTSNSSVVSGLSDIGYDSAPTVFDDDGTFKLIVGEGAGVFNGYNWTGNTWESDSDLIGGLGDIGLGSTPTVFNDSGTWKLISGEEYGVFTGYHFGLKTSIPVLLSYTSGSNWINYTWSAGITYLDSDSFNVSQNGSWSNGSANTWNNASVGLHGHSAIVVYGYNSTENILSSEYLSDNVTQNTAITISNVSSSYLLNEGETLYIDANYADDDGDVGTFSDDSPEFDVNTSTGVASWVTSGGDAGIYTWSINVTDGYGSTSAQDFIIGVNFSLDFIWKENASVINGLPDLGFRPMPRVFNDSGTLKMIVTAGNSIYSGYQWNGTGWEANGNVVAGLGSATTFTIFEENSIWKLIGGNAGVFYGYQWSGSVWTSNSSIVAGLSSLPSYYQLPVEVFTLENVTHLLHSYDAGEDKGYHWNGSSWITNNTIETGLPDYNNAQYSIYLNDYGITEMIMGHSSGSLVDKLYGYQWDGASWVYNSTVTAGVSITTIQQAAPDVYKESGMWKLIVGQYYGDYLGYKIDVPPTVSNLMTEHVVNNLNVYTNTSQPFFNWTYYDTEGVTQHAWEIYVGTASGLSDKLSIVKYNDDTSYIYKYCPPLDPACIIVGDSGVDLEENTTYYIQVRTNDSFQWGDWTLGTFKLNSQPIVSNVIITPGDPIDSDNLVVSNDTATDVDGDSTVVYYKWYKDDVHQPTLNNIVTVLADNTTNNEVWKVGAIPNDGYENGTEILSATVTIGSGHIAPTLTDITSNLSIRKYNQSLLITTSGAFDFDDDNYTLHVGSASGLSDLCNSSSTVNGSEASCVMLVPWTSGSHAIYGRLTDVYDTSIEENVVITIDVTPPVYVSSGVSPELITTEQTATITASLTLDNGSFDYVIAKVINPKFISTNYTMTGTNGSYSYTFTPGLAGNYQVTTIYAADDSGNEMTPESVSHLIEVATGSKGGGGGAPSNVTVIEVGDLTLTPDRRDTYFFYTAVSGEQKGVYKFIANRNLETCRVEPNDDATCEIVDGYIVYVTLTVNETVKTYNGVLTVTDATDHTVSSSLVVRIIRLWGAIPIGEINVGPLSIVATPFFETDETILIGIRTWVVGFIIGLFGLAVFMSRRP